MASYIDQISSLGPKVWYRFNETAGTPVNFGALTTTATFTDLLLNEQTDVDGRATYFNGSSSHIKLNPWPAFSLFDDKSFTVETWFKLSNTTDASTMFRFSGQNAISNRLAVATMGSVDGRLRLDVYGMGQQTSDQETYTTGTYYDSKWHHLVVAVNTTSLKWYIDGNLITTKTLTTGTLNWDSYSASPGNHRLIGTGASFISGNLSSIKYKGWLDEFAIYNYELSAQQVLDNFNAGASVNFAPGVLGTASALSVMPSIAVECIQSASPMIATALFVETQPSNFDYVDGIQKIISDFSPQQWIKFDYVTDFTTTNPFGTLTNYGSGGASGFSSYAIGDAKFQKGPAQEPRLELRLGSGTGGLVPGFATTTASTFFTDEISDSNFSIGIWFKMPTGIDTSDKQVFAYSGGTNSAINLKVSNKKAQFNLQTSHTTYTHTETNDLSLDTWHLAVIKLDLANTTLKYYLDGTEVYSDTAIQGTRNTPTTFSFGKVTTNGTDTTTLFQEIAHFFVSSYSSTTATTIDNLWDAGNRQNQAKGVMPSPIVKFQNKYDDYVDTLSPIQKLGFNETSGTILENTGSNVNTAFQVIGSNYTRGTNVPTKNRYGYNFTNKNTYVSGAYSLPTNAVSDNTATISVYAKISTVSGSDNQIIALWGAGNNAGSGIGLSISANASGPYMSIVPTVNPATWYTLSSGSTSWFGDYHLYTAVRDGSTTRFYIDGKQVASGTYSAYNLTDSGFAAIGGGETVWLGASAATVNKYIDEFASFDYALSAQQIFEMWQAIEIDRMNATTATFVMPTNIAGTGYTDTPAPMTASAEIVMPDQTDEIQLLPDHLEAFAEFLHPNYGGNVVIDANYGHESFTANATLPDPQFQIGDFHSADHMDASALMVHPLSTGGGRITVPTATALDATLVMPGIVAILGARIFAEPMRSNASFILPPDYYVLADDKWYQRLLEVDYQSTQYSGKTIFFNTSNNIAVGGTYGDLSAPSSINLSTTVTPLAKAGYFDPVLRRALNLKNIGLTYDVGGEEYAEGWTFETLIQTTKKNQILATGFYTSGIYANKRSAIRLKDGKIAITEPKVTYAGFINSQDPISFTGFKDIADGEWHHLIIQYRESDERTQVWIDGKLDIQRYGRGAYVPLQIGYNSSDTNASSDFNVSAFAVNKGSFVLEREIGLNYFAAIGHVPYEAEPMTATANIGIGTRAKGNRARALMLYFWPTWSPEAGNYVGSYNGVIQNPRFNTSGDKDVGKNPFDYDTFPGLTTYLTKGTQKFFDWDVFPLPVEKFYGGDEYEGRHPLLKESVTIGRENKYVDPVTDNYRFLNLMEDVYELDQYDAIFFRNYPDQSTEREDTGLTSLDEVDSYFNLQEKELFADFLDSLREAVDTYGISLFVTNPQLAIDLGIIEAATPVPLLRNNGTFNIDEYSDNRAPVVTGRVNAQGDPTDPVNQFSAGWYDTWFNDRHRVVNTLEYLTDDNAFIWTDYAFYQNSDQFNYGGPDRYYARYENRPNGLQIGDEFVFADSGNPKYRAQYQAIKPEHLKAGTPITALGNYIWNQSKDTYVQVDNPYKDYITTVALIPGTNLNGKLTKGKIFVSFSENFSNYHTYENQAQWDTRYVEYHQYDMASNYWVDIAFNAGIIDAETRARYKNSALSEEDRGQPPLYADGDSIKQYWSLSGDNIISQITPVTRNLVGFIGGDVGYDVPEINKKRTRTGLNSLPPATNTRLRDALGRFASGGGSFSATGGNLKTFKIITGRTYDTGTIFIPSINTRGLWWLSDKNVLEGKVVGGVGMRVSATMPNPVVTADHPANVSATAMISQAVIVESNFRSGDSIIPVFPLTASALMPGIGGRLISAAPFIASGDNISPYIYTQSDYVVTLYLRHTDPILYIRKETIK
jgi:hypothetical protein